MTTDYFSDHEAFIASQPLPSPGGTLYTPSRRNSRYGTPASEIASSPPPLPSSMYPETEDEAANNETISMLDPRRFTPTLHANLVSEILNLRRELDSKHRFIEDVELNLHTARTENDSLVKQLSSTAKDNRTAKRQLQHFENEMLAALEEIAGERDKLKDVNADLKSKLEVAEKRSRSQDDDSTRVHDMWAREKEVWAGEKRTLERKVHTSDARLKLLLDELAAHEVAREEARFEGEGDDTKDTNVGAESDTASVRSSPQRRSSTQIGHHSRNLSNSSYRSIGRNYRMSLMSNEGQGRGIGLSLADELIFDEEEEEDLEDLELDSDDFPEHEMRARRVMESRQAMYPDDKAKRILGLSCDVQSPSKDIPVTAEEYGQVKTSHETTHSTVTITPRDITLIFPPTKPIYVDTGVQPSPPASPVLPSMTEASCQTINEVPVQPKPADSSAARTEVDVNQSQANQRRKRTSLLLESPHPSRSASPTQCTMISSAVQTLEQPLSPPPTPKITIPTTELPATPVSPIFQTELVSSSTQTDSTEQHEIPIAEIKRSAPPAPIPIPSIAITAPDSAPSSPKDARLPPGTKTISTQTTSDLVAPMRSYGIQTEPIRVDQRPIKLPPHLLPSAITSKPGTPETKLESPFAGIGVRNDSYYPVGSDTEKFPPKSAARQDLMALLEKAADNRVQVETRYPGNNDNGPLSSNHQNEQLSRPFRSSSLFAGFDGPSSDEEDLADASDDEHRGHPHMTPMLSSRNAKNGRPVNPPTPVPEDKEPTPPSRISEDSQPSHRFGSERASLEKAARITKRNSLGRQPSIRRSAMIQSGTSAHMKPIMNNLGSATQVKPPFPVPMRSSSRNTPLSKSEGSTSPTPGHGGSYANRRMHATKHQRKDSLRKVRSAAPISRSNRSRSRSPTMPTTPSIPDTDSIPPLPSDIMSASGFGHRHQLSTNTAYTASQSVASSNSQSNVVDAIAAAMIGEFMWKYVRKRKAFGVGGAEVPMDRATEEASLSSGGVRHRRWVWISPYERAILWSSKQPTSGSALMGKSGRKLTIQSVLDVADNNPTQRNEPLFNRSILILTPARALKFTAVSRERHYLWLTALSFLAHSSAPMPDLSAMPQPPPVEYKHQRSGGATLRRSRVQDSVRLAKGKANPAMQRNRALNEPMPGLSSLAGFDRSVADSASPPSIPRGPAHGRKRSSTGPGAPPPSIPFRSFSHQQVPSVYSNGSSDKYSSMQPPSVPSSVYNPTSGIVSSRTSEARTSEASTSTRSHFFDAMGTVRMEAFIDDALGDPAQRQGLYVKPRGARHRRSSQWSDTARERPMRAAGLYDDIDNDPFRGF
ncbi:meiotic cell cortex C-terminal pleckstrin homology-domain-containing protein [Boeremia exigua]|uniref:meiotic cell cortex C-terminal pleckstrin homology-domain-containing protein n=1 Tax=Boeremia exigua TaxID=749465 RepID=UPI001E8DDCCB|nr:meiotic cell cortex C-terminal pleckstrin homology-domain-containing protein [Boeremia exigua]KAH6643682.1 meiotic cell cortex C-terminal pleckstrin homology-domain-containing protein [Boeremia exigua]